jgi:uncharacterized protein YraI
MRAGPSTAYPVVAAIGVGNTVEVYGCLSGYDWCDVSIGPSRGWVAGRYLEYVYQSRRVLVPAYGATIGLPIISFTFGDYWERHYVRRPFYRERDRYREIRRERREDRQEGREDQREVREDRQERREDQRERVEDRQERREDVRQNRRERRDEQQDYQRCINRGGKPQQCRQ